MAECEKRAARLKVTELVLVDGTPCTITQRKLTCAEEQDANDFSGYKRRKWDMSRIAAFLERVGKKRIEDVDKDQLDELEREAVTEGDPIASREAFQQMLYKVAFSMGGTIDGSSEGGSLGMGEGWTLGEPVTPAALRKRIDYPQLVALFATANALTYLTDAELKN